MELSLAVNASLVALSKFGRALRLSFDSSLIVALQRSSVQSPFVFRLLAGLMCVVSIKREQSLPRIWCLKVSWD